MYSHFFAKTATFTLCSNKIPPELASFSSDPPRHVYRYTLPFATTGPRHQHHQLRDGNLCPIREELSPASAWLADSECLLRQEERALRPKFTRWLHSYRFAYLVRTFLFVISIHHIRATDLPLALLLKAYIRFRVRKQIALSDPASRNQLIFKRVIYWRWRRLLQKLLTTRIQLARIRSLSARFHTYWWNRATPIGEREATGPEIYEEYLQARLRHDQSTTFI